jgi:glucosamine--fructose-6-phosphate aminotransferase (isomerizing)
VNGIETRMAHEIGEAPAAVRRQQPGLARPMAELVAHLDRRPPRLVVTCARGTSAHAATFAKHLFERGIPSPRPRPTSPACTAGASTSTASCSSPSRSPGAATTSSRWRWPRARRVRSPPRSSTTPRAPAQASDIVLPMDAGPELSVAASKTFVATLSVLLRLTASWSGDGRLAAAITRLPDRLAEAGTLDWSAVEGALAGTVSLVTIGRGPTLAIAREASLKLKETCHLHAEAFSGAEFLHGPVALVSSRYPVLMFMPTDEAAPAWPAGGRAEAKGTARSDRSGAGGLCPRLCRTIRKPTPSA